MTKHIYKHIYSFLLAAVFLFGGAGILSAQEVSLDWELHDPVFSGENWEGSNKYSWYSVTYGSDKFVAVGEGYDSGWKLLVTMYSLDGIHWNLANIPNDGGIRGMWESVTYGDGKFVAVGRSNYSEGQSQNRGIIMYSTDGINWSSPNLDPSGEFIQWHSVAYGDGKFVAVGWIREGGGQKVAIMTSADGETWEFQEGPEGEASKSYWASITYGNGLFVVVSDASRGIREFEDPEEYNHIMISSNGIDWELKELYPDNENYWHSVTYGNGLFVAVAIGSNYMYEFPEEEWPNIPIIYSRVMTSPDGINWTPRYIPGYHDTEWSAVTYGNGLFVAVSWSDNGSPYEGGDVYTIATSPDGINWTAFPQPDPETGEPYPYNGWNSIAYGDGKFVVVGNGNGRMTAMTANYEGDQESTPSKSSNIFGTRFCSAGVTTFCRPQNGFVNNNPLVNIYTELLGLYQQLLTLMQGQEN